MDLFERLRILYIERDTATQSIMHNILRKSTLSVHTARSPQKALRILTKVSPDLVLTELWIPTPQDGIALTQEIKAHYPDIPVFIHSWEDPGQYGLVADGYLPKPLMFGELEKVFRRILKQKHAAAEL